MPTTTSRSRDETKAPDRAAADKPHPQTPAGSPASSLPPPRITIKTEPPAQTPSPARGPVTPKAQARATISAPLAATQLGPTIRTTALTARDQVIADIESRISAAEAAMGSLGGASAETRKQLRAASSEVKKRGHALRKSIEAARKANAPDWDRARSQLAADYEAYAATLARVDAAADMAASSLPK